MDTDHNQAASPDAATLSVDPVCGMKVAVETAKWSVEQGGKTWYFCGQSCLKKFEANPEKYDGTQKHTQQSTFSVPAAVGSKYTCPMHSEIFRDKPGSCPICGMALEPLIATDDETANPELISMTRRLWIGTVLTLPLLAIMISDLMPSRPLHNLISGTGVAWLEFALA